MNKGVIVSLAVLLFAVSPALATPTIMVGDHPLLPNMADQTIEISVTGGDEVEGLDFFVQIGDGTDGPIISDLDVLIGTIFDGKNTGGSAVYQNDRTAAFVTTTPPGQMATTDGLLATVTVDTTGLMLGDGPWDLNLEFGTFTTAFATIPAEITNGSISIVPEPATVAMLLGVFAMAPLALFYRRRSK